MPKRFTTREAAKRIGVSAQTLYTWIARGLVEAPPQIQAGRATFRLWDAADIAKVKEFNGSLRRGPKKGVKEA